MYDVEKKCLVDFFKAISEEFEYVVMRNANELPYDNFSNDVDILIDHSKYKGFERTMKKVFLKHGFDRVESTSYHGIECYTFYNIQNDTPYSLKIDLFFNVEGGGVRYFNFNDVIQYKIKNDNGIYVWNLGVESYLTALKTLAAGGKLKNKYLKSYLENPLEENHNLIKKCPSKTLSNYLNQISLTNSNLNKISRRKIIFETIISNFKSSPIGAIGRIIHHYKLEVSRAFIKQYMMVFVGPDGSGKTTLIEKMKSDSIKTFRSLPSRFHVFHHRPHFLKNISQLFKGEMSEKEVHDINFNPHSGKQSNAVVSFLKLIYYASDYILGYLSKILPLQRQNKFIVFDRYFYDFIVDQKRSALYVPRKLAILIYKLLIPKPNKIFFIKVDPIQAHNRKKELSVEMIKKINNEYDSLTEKLDNFMIIHNDNLDVAYSELLKNVVIVITKKVKID